MDIMQCDILILISAVWSRFVFDRGSIKTEYAEVGGALQQGSGGQPLLTTQMIGARVTSTAASGQRDS